MRIGLIGDLHANIEGGLAAAIEWMERTEPDFCLQVGDFWSYDVEFPVPVHWIFGNHERSRDVNAILEGSHEFPPNNHWLIGGLSEIEGVTVMALPGLTTSRGGPGPASFPPNVYSLCWEQAHDRRVDIFLSHGAAFPFWHFGWDDIAKKGIRINFEEPDITELVRWVGPTHAVSGHNHRFAIEEFEGITCFRLGSAPNHFAHMIEVP